MEVLGLSLTAGKSVRRLPLGYGEELRVHAKPGRMHRLSSAGQDETP